MIISKNTTRLRYLLPLLLVLSVNFASIGLVMSAERISREEYVSRYKHIAISHQQRYGIPASITMAQGILESDSGNSHLAKGSNNHFGIKCKSNWTGRTFTHTDDAPDECFRAYDSVEASYEDHAIFLDSSPRYDSLFLFSPTDYHSWARALKGAGYATASDYTARLVQLIESNKLYLLDAEAAKGSGGRRLARNNSAEVDRLASYGANVDPNNFRVAINSHSGYNLYRTNKTLYVVSKEGDSYASLATTFGLSQSAIYKYNDLSRGADLAPRSVVYIEPKQRKWLGNVRRHTLLEGESLHSVAQSYGIKESSLRKRNRIKSREAVQVGQELKLK